MNKVEIYLYKWGSTTPEYKGYINQNTDFDAEKYWDMCNWSCKGTPKPGCLVSDLSYCNHGIVFVNPETKLWHLALSTGWLVGDRSKIQEYVNTHVLESYWK